MALDRVLSRSSSWLSTLGVNIVTLGGRYKSSPSSSRTPSPPCTPKTEPSSSDFEIKMRDVFRYFDRNGDGKVSANEIRAYFTSVGEYMSYDEAKQIINELDTDGDEMLDFQEFVNVMRKDNQDDEDNELKLAFEMFEHEKGSGCITPKGLQIMLEKIGDLRTYNECAAMINVFDANRDGVLDFQEFRQMMTTTA
uniref:Putative calcium-binding protein CML41 n=1 Tax=Sedum alfredii TaxID=439688 RepID=A0A8E4XYY9_9MAGN|nr:putative calcium-binding protein CML41 [Sedum alfredii]